MTWVLLQRERVDSAPGKPTFHGHVIVATFTDEDEAQRWHGLDTDSTYLVEVDDQMGDNINNTLRSRAN